MDGIFGRGQRNYCEFTFYWHWSIGRFVFMIWTHGKPWKAKHGFWKRSDGGWVLNLFPDISIQWQGR